MTDYYMKNPVVVQAYQYFGDDFDLPTLEGKYTVTEGYWIVTGVKGEKYPVRDDIFKETYHRVGNGTLSDTDRINEYIKNIGRAQHSYVERDRTFAVSDSRKHERKDIQ
jgi:hypothetical protein